MTNELEILRSVDSTDKITQRELAKRTGLSLGAVNVLIKRLMHKGLLKIEHINTRTIRYILTPKGLLEKARLTYDYIVFSYKYISVIENRIVQIIDNKTNLVKIILFGKKDELYEIITSKLNSINQAYKYIDEVSKLKMYNNERYIIIVWNPEDKDTFQNEKSNIYNILNEI